MFSIIIITGYICGFTFVLSLVLTHYLTPLVKRLFYRLVDTTDKIKSAVRGLKSWFKTWKEAHNVN